MNTQETYYNILLATSAQSLIQLDDTSTKVDTTIKVDIVDTTQTVEVKEPIKEQARQKNVPNAQTQGAPQLIVIDQGRSDEDKDIPKEKEKEAI